MNLFTETAEFLAWFCRVLRTFLRVRPWTTIGIILMAACSRVMYVLASFMPLKVVLLAGSSGVPKYFRFFMTAEHKEGWIIVLALGAVACYVMSVVLDALTDRLSVAGSEDVLQDSEAIPLVNNQQDVARDYYAKCCGVCANTIFLASAFAAGLFVNLPLFVFVAALALCFYAVSALVVRSSDLVRPGRIALYMQENLSGYLRTLSTVAFLSGFGFLLLLFVSFDYSNVLGAILSIIIIRQTMNALVITVKDGVFLQKARHEIDALVFRDVQLQAREDPLEKAHRELFGRNSRRRILKKELGRVIEPLPEPVVAWQDPTIPGLDSFSITFDDDTAGVTRHLILKVFPPRQFQKLEHELFLFSHVPRTHLPAPELVLLFYAGPFQCQVCRSGSGRPVPGSEWATAETALTKQVWACRPPAELVRVYSASAPLLHHRLNDELVARLEIAVDSEEEWKRLGRFRKNLPGIRERLRSIPLFVYNPDLNRYNVALRYNGGYLVTSWCRWKLEPLGAGMPRRLRKKQLTPTIDKMRRAREDIPDRLSREDLLLAALCFDLENLVKKRRYKAALEVLETIPPLRLQP
jgi:hypothetical protein